MALADIAPEWTVELEGICADAATLVVVPESGDDEVGPSFVISRESLGLRLDQVHWDIPQEIGMYPKLVDVIAAIRLRLACGSSAVSPVSLTLH